MDATSQMNGTYLRMYVHTPVPQKRNSYTAGYVLIVSSRSKYESLLAESWVPSFNGCNDEGSLVADWGDSIRVRNPWEEIDTTYPHICRIHRVDAWTGDLRCD